MSGLFPIPPLDDLVVSLLAVVPKKEPNKFRLIQHSPYPKGRSLNTQAKTGGWDVGFYVDRCLPTGCSLSCAYFEAFSSCLEWAVRDSVIHYLDDFMCIGPDQSQCCEVLLRTVVWIAERFGVPLAPGKTEGPCTSLSFLGIVVDSEKWEFRLPVDKVLGLRSEVARARHLKKLLLREVQSLPGKLNFACRIIPMGRVFSRRLASATAGVRAPHHFVHLSVEHKANLEVWDRFLACYNGRSLLMEDVVGNTDLDLFTDASGGIVFGAFFGGRWCAARWPEEWFVNGLVKNITLLEIFPILVAFAQGSFGAWCPGCGTSNSGILGSQYVVGLSVGMEFLGDSVGVARGANTGQDHVGALLLWLRLGVDQGWSAAKVDRIIAALAFGFRLRGCHDLTKSFLVKQAVKGLKRACTRGDRRRPVSFEILEQFGARLEGNQGKHRVRPRFWFGMSATPTFIGARSGQTSDRMEDSSIFSRDVAVLRWLGFRGLGWNRVMQEVHNGVRFDRPPDILVLHVGGNDLGVHPCRELIRDIKLDLLRLWASFREMSIAWSVFVPWKSWRHARSVDTVNKARIKVNWAVSGFVVRNGGLAVRHFEVERGSDEFLLGDGVHLNAVGSIQIEGSKDKKQQIWKQGVKKRGKQNKGYGAHTAKYCVGCARYRVALCACYCLLLEALRSKGVHRRAVSSARPHFLKPPSDCTQDIWKNDLPEKERRVLP
ncbi:unnamed protein product [Ranitomeya imitator]|uniref:ribonuclease H n=1 Tax=Ranitomeya imitator TaxID=111125 RepID=A0ABN9KXC3_9NEOB|nr:unnamed protein product [Ranitomeya imitator]